MTGWAVPGYTETSSLGSGATGRVVAAVDDATGEPVAIKYLSPRFVEDEAFLERFRAEAELLAGLDHPNVVRFHRYFETEGGAALVMELVRGATLRKVLKSAGPVSPEAALSVMRGSLLGLDAAHGVGIVHRDYKPANVLLTEDGVSKLADFGIAERAGAETQAIGTPSYMAPEQWEGAPSEPVTDIYAVTASFYECLTGHVPYKADTVFELEELHRTAPIPLADVPPAVRGLVAHGLAKDAALRPADVPSFIAELEEAAVSEYGVEWEEKGRRDLAVFVWPLFTGSAGGGSSSAGGLDELQQSEEWFGFSERPHQPEPVDDGFEEESARAWRRIGRGTKAGLAAAVVAVLGSVLAAVAFGSDTKTKTPVAGSTGITLSASASSAALSDTPSDTLPAGINAPTPGTPTPTTPSPTPTPTSTSSSTKPTPTAPPSSAVFSSLPSAGPTSSAASTPPPSTPGAPSTPSPSGVSSVPSSPKPPPTTSTPSTTPTTPSSTPSPKPKITATLTMVTASQPCPPSQPQSYQVTFTVSGLPAGTSVPISYDWRLVSSGGGAKGQITASNGSNSAEFRVKAVQDTVIVDWSTPDGQSGSSNWVRTCEIIG